MKSVLNKIKKQSKKIPNSPGVYFWRDAKKQPIYIGRASSLKKRIASYFRTKDFRIQEMVESARSLDFQKTDTLLEAVISEANLIKKYWPKYNVIDKDDRSFVYLIILPESGFTQDGRRFTQIGNYPKPLIVRGKELEKYRPQAVKIFGPYQSYYLLRESLKLVRRIFPFSSGNCKPLSGYPCFDYQIGLCPGVCVGVINKKDYQKNIKNLEMFFAGEKSRLLKKLKRDASTGSARDTKDASRKIAALNHVEDAALLASSGKILGGNVWETNGRIEGYDISHLSGQEPVGGMVVFENGIKNPEQYRLFKIKGYAAGTVKNYDDLKMIAEVLSRRLHHREWELPQIIFVDGGLGQVKVARAVLNKNNLSIPVVGLSKAGMHSASSYMEDKLVIAGAKKSSRDLIIASKKLFQEIRNEAHRFAIGFSRRRRRKFN